MTKQKSTKKTLLTSVLSLVLCMAMLVGTTFAWFTDSVTSGNNKIKAGNLDVQLLMHNGTDYVDISNSTSPIFGAGSVAQNVNGETLWEPGKTQVAYLAIQNNGSLDLKYTVALDVTNVTKNLDKVMRYAITSDAKNGSITAWDSTNAKTVALGNQTVSENDVALEAGDTHYFALSVHMMEDAGNEYQNGTIDFDMTVLATQLASEYDSFNNQYDKDASTDDAILAHGGVITFTEDREEDMTVAKDAVVTVNFNNYTLNNSLTNNGEVTVNDGTIEVAGAGLDNFGIATLTDVVMNAGSAADYANRTSGAEAKTTYDDVTINSAGGGVGVADGATVTFNSGSVEVNSTSTSGRYLFYVVGEGSELTINNGNFDFNKTQNQKRAYIYAGAGATVYVNGGTFGKASTRSGYTAGILGDGNVIIKGGTFGFDPTKWVAKADGYSAVRNADGTYSVLWGTPATNVEDAQATLNNGGTATFVDNMNSNAIASNGYGKTGINMTNGGVLNGNGKTLTTTGANGTWDSAINITSGTIKNLTIAQGFRGVFVNHNGTVNGHVTLENVIIDGPTYTISCDQGTNNGLTAKGCTFNGWTSYAATIGDVQFEDCNFGEGAGYAFCRPYAPTTFVDCDFEAGYKIDPRAAITFENCTIGGVALTAENLSTLVTSNIAKATVK